VERLKKLTKKIRFLISLDTSGSREDQLATILNGGFRLLLG